MRELEAILDSLVSPWLQKAEANLRAAHLIAEKACYSEAVALHCQIAAEQFLKALLTHLQIEFRKTRNLAEFLDLVASAQQPLPISRDEALWLTPFGFDFESPADVPEMLPGDEHRAIDIAERVRRAVFDRLGRP